MKNALITGITGQDGAYLARFLIRKGYKVYGTFRRTSTPNFWRLCYLGIEDKVNLIAADITDMSSIMEAIIISEPEEIYNLAAQSFVAASFDKPILTAEVDALGTTRILECIRMINPKIKFYQASTSELYGNSETNNNLINEETLMKPVSPYAAAKIYSYHTVKIYRDAYGIFATNGILFNHESPIRGLEFVTRKITNAVAEIKFGIRKSIELGNIESIRDWGYAEEYIEGMWRMLQHNQPDDFVVATGEAHSVKEFLKFAFERADLDYRDFLKINKNFIRPIDVNFLLGDNSKMFKELKWKPKTKFKKLVEHMVDEDIIRWDNYKKGKVFPWDALNYPDNLNLINRSKK